MRVIVKGTGETVEVEMFCDGHSIERSIYNEVGTSRQFLESDLKFIKEPKVIDWEQRRYEIAKSTLNGIISNPITKNIDDDLIISVMLVTDALIEKLKIEQR